jgi:hypothetical protein
VSSEAHAKAGAAGPGEAGGGAAGPGRAEQGLAVAGSRRVIPLRWPAAVALAVVGVVGLFAFIWPFVVPAEVAIAHGNDAPWFFAVLIALLAVVCLAEVSAG